MIYTEIMPHKRNIFNIAMHKRFQIKIPALILVILFTLFCGTAFEVRAQTEHTRDPQKPVSEENETKNPNEPTEKVDENIVALEKKAFDLLNEARKKENHPPLVWSERLAAIARQHSKDMDKHSFFSIEPFGGRKLSDLVVESGVKKWLNIGRLIATNAGIDDPVEQIVNRWLSSKERRLYVFENAWSETGIGIVITESGRFYLTQDFLSK